MCFLAFAVCALYLFFRAYRAQADLSRLPTYLPNNPTSKAKRNSQISNLAITCLIAFLFSVAIAEPFLGSKKIKIPTNPVSILIVLDVSESMNAKDVKPTRLAVAKRTVKKIISKVQDFTPIRSSIILFSGASYQYCPLTLDADVLEHFLNSASSELISTPGSSILGALERASNIAKKHSLDKPIVLFVTDGDDNVLTAKPKIPDSVKNIVGDGNIFVLGIGTESGTTIASNRRGSYGQLLYDRMGNVVITRREDKKLKAFTAALKGEYIKASRTSKDYEGIIRFIKKNKPKLESFKDKEKDKYTTTRILPNHIGHYSIALGLICLLISHRRLAFLFIFIISVHFFNFKSSLLQLPQAHADSSYQTKEYNNAVEYFYKERYEEANKILKQIEKNKENSIAPEKFYDTLGSTYYKLDKYDKAIESYTKSINSKSKNNSKEKFFPLYNRANSYFKSKNFKKAIEDYQKALELVPNEKRAFNNLESAKKLLEQQKQQEQKQEQNQKDKKDDKDQNKQKNNKDQESKSNQKKDSKGDSSKDKKNKNKDSQDNESKKEKEQNKKKDKQDKNSQSKNKDEKKDKSKKEKNPSPQNKKEKNKEKDDKRKNESKKDKRLLNSNPKSGKNDQKKGDKERELSESVLNIIPEAPLLLRRQRNRDSNLPFDSSQTW